MIEENSGEVRNDLIPLNIRWNLNILRDNLKGGGQLNLTLWSFIHLRYFYSYSPLGYFLMKCYFSIFGGSMIGFSVIGADRDGNPVYVGGLWDAAESDVLRYYLTILAYMDSLKIPVEQRFEKRMSQWYALTARYKRQLFEVEREEYLTYRRQDQEIQLILQGALNRFRQLSIQIPLEITNAYYCVLFPHF